jgi:hypothetical protein
MSAGRECRYVGSRAIRIIMLAGRQALGNKTYRVSRQRSVWKSGQEYQAGYQLPEECTVLYVEATEVFSSIVGQAGVSSSKSAGRQ